MSCTCGRARRARAPARLTTRVRAVSVRVPALLLVMMLFGACHSGSSAQRLPRPRDQPVTDPAARNAMLELLANGSHATWWVDATFTRTVSGRTFRSDLTEVNRPPDHVVVGAGGLSGVLHGASLECTQASPGALCNGAGGAPPTADAATLGSLTDPNGGSYALRGAPAQRIAGLTARCFRLDWNARAQAQPYGTRATLCFAPDGVPLVRDVVRPGATDHLLARSVHRDVTDAGLDALVAPYANAGPARPLTPGTPVVPVVPVMPSGS